MGQQPSGMLRNHQSKLNFFYRISDLAIISFVWWMSAYYHGEAIEAKSLVLLFVVITLFSIFSDFLQLYRSFRGAKWVQIASPVIKIWLMSVFIMLAAAYTLDILGAHSLAALIFWIILSPLAMLIWRFIVRGMLSKIREKGFNTRRVAIIGAETLGLKLAKTITETHSLGLRFVGFYDDRKKNERISEEASHQLKGNVADLIKSAWQGHIDIVYITLSAKAQDKILHIIRELSDTAVSVYLVPDLSIFDALHTRLINLGDIPTFSVNESPYFGAKDWIKRLEDIILSIIILNIVAVPMLLIALGIKLTSPGPVIFKQRRYGVDGREIKIWKFRSMITTEDGDIVRQVSRNDSRVTPLGSWLRKLSLDELPQFFNVLMGEMSIVGPRPHAVSHNEKYRKIIGGYMLRYKVKPGITGWAQINGWRGETDTPEKMEKRVEFDIYYIRNWSLSLDLWIILQTIYKGFFGKNAY